MKGALRMILFALTGLVPQVSGGAPITWTFRGEVSTILRGTIDPGFRLARIVDGEVEFTKVTGSLTFDFENPFSPPRQGCNDELKLCSYLMPGSMTIAIEGHLLNFPQEFAGYSLYEVSIELHPGYARFSAGDGGRPASYDGEYIGDLGEFGGSSSASFTVYYGDQSVDRFNLLGLEPPSTLEGFNHPFGFSIYRRPTPPNLGTLVTGVILDVGVAPEPSALALVSLLVAFCAWRRRAYSDHHGVFVMVAAPNSDVEVPTRSPAKMSTVYSPPALAGGETRSGTDEGLAGYAGSRPERVSSWLQLSNS